MASAAPLDPAILAAYHAQQSGAPQRRVHFDLPARRAALHRLASAVRAHEDQIIAALHSDFAKPAAETILTEILPVLQSIRHASRNLRRWMRPTRAAPTVAMLGTSAQVVPQARGTCLIIAPWNYPFMLTLGPLVSALAAGNSAILKPSELTPTTSALIAKIITDTFPPDQVAVAQGGRDVAQALLALPFDHIFFTGSPAVGKVVMQAAAQTLTSVTLELGGKSPAIVTQSAQIEKAAAWIAFGKFANAGQTCIAPDHVYVHASVQQAFVTALRARIANSYGAGADSPHLAQIVNDAHGARLGGLLTNALSLGAQRLLGAAQTGRRLPPTLIAGITPQMDISSEEIFGPILPIIPYNDLDIVIDTINARPKPLALYVFDRARSAADRVIAATSSGSVGVNLTMAQFAHLGLPFGGIGMSGMGAAHGKAGFDTFSHRRALLRNWASPLPLLFPPYTARVRKLIDLVKRALG